MTDRPGAARQHRATARWAALRILIAGGLCGGPKSSSRWRHRQDPSQTSLRIRLVVFFACPPMCLLTHQERLNGPVVRVGRGVSSEREGESRPLRFCLYESRRMAYTRMCRYSSGGDTGEDISIVLLWPAQVRSRCGDGQQLFIEESCYARGREGAVYRLPCSHRAPILTTTAPFASRVVPPPCTFPGPCGQARLVYKKPVAELVPILQGSSESCTAGSGQSSRH